MSFANTAARPLSAYRAPERGEQVPQEGYTAFVAERPTPTDAVERTLLRLTWLVRRVSGRA